MQLAVGKGYSMGSHWVDILAVSFFVIEWVTYGFTLEHTAYGRTSLSSRMNAYREVWARRLLDREARMVDMQVVISLQTGTAFFASTSLLAIGGGLALLRATNDALAVFSKLPVDISPSPALWEMKCVGLILIFIYAFFKFAWSYRLFNYVAIMVGAMPLTSQRDTAEAERHVLRTARLFESGGPAFQPRPARVLLRARLSRLVRQPVGAVLHHGTGRGRDLAAAIRLQCLARDGRVRRLKSRGVKVRSIPSTRCTSRAAAWCRAGRPRAPRPRPSLRSMAFREALPSFAIGSPASLPSGVIRIRILTNRSSDGASEAGSFEHCLIRPRNALTMSVPTSALAAASPPSPFLSPASADSTDGGSASGRPSMTLYLTVTSGSGGT